jgi:hypothetical protein
LTPFSRGSRGDVMSLYHRVMNLRLRVALNLILDIPESE